MLYSFIPFADLQDDSTGQRRVSDGMYIEPLKLGGLRGCFESSNVQGIYIPFSFFFCWYKVVH